MTIRVFMVDDHALVRTGLRMVLSNEVDIEVIGEADDGETAIAQIRKLKPDVVLCDLHLPGISGLEITERLMGDRSPPRVIVVSVLEDGPLPARLLEAGASGYVGKGGDAQELVNAVREVAAGNRYLGNRIARNMAFSSVNGRSPIDVLSHREVEVAMLLVQGLRQGEVADQLCLSPKTVNTHKTSLFRKLGVRDLIALTRLLQSHGLVDPASKA